MSEIIFIESQLVKSEFYNIVVGDQKYLESEILQ
jgi:hypothetical protein